MNTPRVLACLSLVGAASLCCLLGAAVMHFRLATADFMRNAFIGAEAWSQKGRPVGIYVSEAVENKLTKDQPDKTCDGFTLYTTNSGPWAALMDMKGNVVHQWKMPFEEAWPKPTHVDPVPKNQYWFGFHLYPSGELLVVYHGNADTPYGYGLVKLDKDSKLLWRYSARVHHEIEVGEDGTIYALSQKLAGKAPSALDFIPEPYIADTLDVLSPDGTLRDQVPILEALRDSKYVATLQMTTRALMVKTELEQQNPQTRRPIHELAHGDLTHLNSVKVLGKELAAKFPLFQAGQVLLSIRNMDALAVLDVKKRSVVWLAQGCWRRQHAADFLMNGRLLVYDNLGAEVETRVLEYDPVTHAMPWSYANENATSFRAEAFGHAQRLPNGNTLIVHPGTGRIFEVTADKNMVWESFCRGPIVDEMNQVRLIPTITSAWRYPADQLEFLKGVAKARP